jgi:hypothetical protein
MFFSLWSLPPGTVIAKVGVGVTIAATAGGVLRFVYYDLAASGFPGPVLLDVPSQQDATVTAGSDTEAGMVTITGGAGAGGGVVVPASGFIWAAVVVQGAPATLPTLRALLSTAAMDNISPMPNHPGTSMRNAFATSGVTGAPPANPVLTVSGVANVPWLIQKVA